MATPPQTIQADREVETGNANLKHLPTSGRLDSPGPGPGLTLYNAVVPSTHIASLISGSLGLSPYMHIYIHL